MLDWVGSLRIRERSTVRVVLGLTRSTRLAGLAMIAAGLAGAAALGTRSPWALALPLVVVGLGALVSSLRRDLTVDRAAGVLRIEQGMFGLGTRTVVPLFHIRAVVVVARPVGLGAFDPVTRFVAFLERRIGEPIYLDEARRCAGLLRLAEAIAEVAEVRLEYDARAGRG